MRDSQLQTPQRDQTSANRRLKSTSELTKNPRKVAKKSLNPSFKAFSEEDSAVLESFKEFSEVSDESPFGESAEDFLALVKAADPHISDTLAISNLSSPSFSSSSIITSDKLAITSALDAQSRSPEVEFFKKRECVEAELVIQHLREARNHVLKSKDMNHSKKLLDALINIIIEEFYGGLYDKKDWLDIFLSNKINLVFLTLVIGVFAAFMHWFFNSSAVSFHTGPMPT